MPDEWERVEDSMEAGIGAGILSACIEMARSSFVRGVEADPDQVGADAVFYVHMSGDVILRCRVDEVRPRA